MKNDLTEKQKQFINMNKFLPREVRFYGIKVI